MLLRVRVGVLSLVKYQQKHQTVGPRMNAVRRLRRQVDPRSCTGVPRIVTDGHVRLTLEKM